MSKISGTDETSHFIYMYITYRALQYTCTCDNKWPYITWITSHFLCCCVLKSFYLDFYLHIQTLYWKDRETVTLYKFLVIMSNNNAQVSFPQNSLIAVNCSYITASYLYTGYIHVHVIWRADLYCIINLFRFWSHWVKVMGKFLFKFI